jgi:beta-glucanase (GH16 family)
LVITVRRQSIDQADFVSASLSSQGRREFTYGYFEARIRVPSTMGIWPAWWLEGSDSGGSWPRHGEVDIMEQIDTNDGNRFAVRGGPNQWAQTEYSHLPVRDPTAWHIYAARLSPDGIDFYLDGARQLTVVKSDLSDGEYWPFGDVPQFLRLNVAYGGDLPAGPDPTSVLPASMYVDYVRVFGWN